MKCQNRPFWIDGLYAAEMAGRTLLNAWCAVPSTLVAEISARSGWDTATVDLQHGLIDYQMAVEMIRAIESTGVLPMARAPWLEPGIVMKLLDAGARGLICPMINTAQDAEALVSYTSFAPRGKRSFGPTRVGMLTDSYRETADEGVFRGVQIETEEAVDNVKEIAAVDGVGMLYVGPSDLAITMGLEPRLDPTEPKVVSAIRHVADVSSKAGLIAGIHCATPENAREMAAIGYRFITIQSDVRLLAASNATLVRAARDQIAQA